MAQHWKELLPIDIYTVASNGILHDYDRKVITLLYQPLIGHISLSLYMTLWAQMEENRLWSQTNSHHNLMSLMDLNLKDIYEARMKLEGIGLLKTLVQTSDGPRSFIYELQPPLPPDQFFLDGMLNIYLYQKVGKNQFSKLKQFFSDKAISLDEGYEDVTRAFQDVYDSVVPSSSITDSEEVDTDDLVFIGRYNQKGIQVDMAEGFDFDLLFAGLSESLVPKKTITQKVKDAISNLAFLYGIDPIQMKNLLISAMDEIENKINIEELRKSARDWYQLENKEKLPQLIDKIQPILKQTDIDVPKTKEEKFIRYLDTTSPRQFLIDISDGAIPSKADLQIIEDVMFKQKLLPGVVNVLIHYVLLRTDMKLTKAYVDKIASHWSRKKISTVKDAIELAKNEHRQYMEWAENKKIPKSAARKKPIRTEALPDWFEEKEKGTSSYKKENTEEQEDIAELLREFKNRG